MLNLPLQFKQQCFKASTSTTTTTSQLRNAEIGAGCCGIRSGHHTKICRLSRRIRNHRGFVLDRDVIVNHFWRLKRSYSSGKSKNQQFRVTIARDASSTGSPLVAAAAAVSYTATPSALDTYYRASSPNSTSIEDEERFLNALVASVPLRGNVDHHREEAGSGFRVSNRREEKRGGEAKKANGRKQKLPLRTEGVRITPELEQKRVDWASNADHLRQLEEKVLLMESVDVDTAKVLASYPAIVNISVDNLKSVIQHLESCGLKKKDLGRVFSMTPQILGLGVEDNLRPTVRFLLNEVGLARSDLRKVIIRCPRLLVASVDSQLRPAMHFLESLGFTRMASLVYKHCTLLTFGIQSKLLPKVAFLQTLGMSRDEAVTLVLRFPAIFNYGVEQNLKPKYDYLVNVMRRDVSHLKAFPQYFGYSLDSRIRPRFEYLFQRSIQVSLPNFLKLSDDEFDFRFKGIPAKGAGEDRKHAADIGSQGDEAREKLKEKLEFAAANGSLAPIHSRIPMHICL